MHIYVYAWVASIFVATLAACIIAVALPNSPADELDRAVAAQAIVTGFVGDAPRQHRGPNAAQQ
jgi:hypothetical protein